MNPHLSAATADKFLLYQEAVQDAGPEIAFITRVFKRSRGRKPLSLREDFCGTALISAQWAKSDKRRTATGVDLSASTLAWGRKHNLAPLGEAAARVTLERRNVLKPVAGAYDVIAALNFSYFTFKTRAQLGLYFRVAYDALAQDGMLVLDLYGGSDAQIVLTEKKRCKGFTYEWAQAAFNPIDSRVINHIHFGFPDGSRMERAFTYDWRLWQPAEIMELLTEAGFADVQLYWEDDDPTTGQGNGVFRPRKRVENCPGWIAYISAAK